MPGVNALAMLKLHYRKRVLRWKYEGFTLFVTNTTKLLSLDVMIVNKRVFLDWTNYELRIILFAYKKDVK